MNNQVELLINNILKNSQHLKEILVNYEKEDVADEEIRLSLLAIKNIKYLQKKSITLSTFLPLNLPLFSFVTYVLIPSLICEKVYYKPSSYCVEVSKKIHELFNNIIPNIYIYNGDRHDFLTCYVSKSDVVIFVGSTKNSYEVRKYIKKDAMFLCFGNGVNTIVAFNNTDVNQLIEKVFTSIMFNDGQDCGKPSLVFLQSNIAKQVIDAIKAKTSKYFANIKRDIDINNLIKFCQSNRDIIINQVCINVTNNQINPIITEMSINDIGKIKKISYEIYGPVFNFVIFNDPKELKNINQVDVIRNNLLFTSKFGDGKIYFAKDIVFPNKTILEYDNGYNEFGNYNDKCFYLLYKGIEIAKPLLVNREIDLLYRNEWFDYKLDCNNIRKRKKALLKNIYKSKIIDIFKDNLVYSFIFGSFKKNKKNVFNDIDIFICTKRYNKKQINEFREFYFYTHYMFGLKPDKDYPGEIITINQLQKLLNKNISINNINISSEEFDYIFYNQVLLDKKEELYGKFEDMNISLNILYKNSKTICTSINKIVDYSKYKKRVFNKSLFALATWDILYFAQFLKYPIINNEDGMNYIRKIDDGLLMIYESEGNNEFN